MATRKPDWAQRMVEKLLEDCTALPEADGWIAIKRHDLESLLRVRHRKVKRVVQAIHTDCVRRHRVQMSLCEGIRMCCRHILAKLKELER